MKQIRVFSFSFSKWGTKCWAILLVPFQAYADKCIKIVTKIIKENTTMDFINHFHFSYLPKQLIMNRKFQKRVANFGFFQLYYSQQLLAWIG